MVSHWLQAVISALVLGQVGMFLLFLKAGGKIMSKMSPLCQDNFYFFLLVMWLQ